MYPNFEEILEELSYKVGIVDLTNESHKQILIKLLRERGIDSAQQLTDRASVVFEYIKEVTKKDPALSAMPKASTSGEARRKTPKKISKITRARFIRFY